MGIAQKAWFFSELEKWESYKMVCVLSELFLGAVRRNPFFVFVDR